MMHISRMSLVVLALLLLAMGTNQEKPEGAAKPAYGETVKLFNGKNLDGWTAYFQGGNTDPSEAFFVEDGILKCKGRPIGYIQTKKKYASYELVVEWRFNAEKGAGNSGVLMRISGEDHVWPTSIEAQLHSRNAGDIWNIGDFPMETNAERTQGRRTRKEHSTNEKPLGEWNRYRIFLDGSTLTLEVNGLVQNVAKGCRVAPGRIGLQSEGAWIEFRKVELREVLPAK